MQDIIHKMIQVLFVAFGIAYLSCCKPEDNSAHSDWVLTQSQRDSINFSRIHHFNTGKNFIVKADSIIIYSRPDKWSSNTELETITDSHALNTGVDFVVTEIFRPTNYKEENTDSVWLYLVSDETHSGWIEETAMLDKSSPISPISQFIYKFSNTHVYVFAILTILMAVIVCYCKYKRILLWFVHFRDVTSFYPCAFTITTSTASMIYCTLQKFESDVWTEYYFNPSLNPFNKPALICTLLILLWMSVLLLLSVVFDLYDKVSFIQVVTYILSLICTSCAIYITLTLTIPLGVGYLIYILYLILTITRFFKVKLKPSPID